MNVFYFLKVFCHNPQLTVNDFLDAFLQSRKAPISFVISVYLPVCVHATARLPLDGFPGVGGEGIYIYIYIYIYDDFMKICRETPKFVKPGLISGT